MRRISNEPYDTDVMAREFSMQFPQHALTVGQDLVFQFQNDKQIISLKVKEMEVSMLNLITVLAVNVGTLKGYATAAKLPPCKIEVGMLLSNSAIIFEKAETSSITLVGKCKGKQAFRSIINPDWDFQKMGIGGLDNEFSAIFRRAFASRVFPPEFIEQLGMKHVRGILLHGPPGTGKTLMARQIGKMLNAREPKIINGPQILDKYVGESEANIRKLFADAEEEAKRVGINSGLHIIIFDEIDAICKQRGSVAGSTAVHDTVVNQLLAKLDGVEQLNNILVIGMTNRLDMIDEALLRPGRLEVQMEIGLPDEKGRLQILNIHVARMREFDKLASDVDINELAALTKNFSGAEIEGLVRAAQSSAMNRLVKAFGHSSDQLDRFISAGVIIWNSEVREILDVGDLLVRQTKSPDCRGLVSVLIEGPPNSGKTAIAAKIAKNSDFPFIKVVSPEDMVGYSETAKCAVLRKAFDDAYKSPLSVLLVDNLERLIDYGRIGPRYSNLVLQALLVLIKKQPPPVNFVCGIVLQYFDCGSFFQGRRLLIIATTSLRSVMEDFEVVPAFSSVLHISPLRNYEDILAVLEQTELFDPKEIVILQNMMQGKRYLVGIKKLLDIIDLTRQSEEEYRVALFSSKLDEGSSNFFTDGMA
ncbi:unnamed protein product [Soboliphyme baturini]|uniref:Vesicle-fusing ATPase n=1 Tax=Soboliphyme baturini TaxID=241478 RepID=A0A183IJE3_9BILA|nr:unnamed protein product [Soboliphyme baturini]